MCSFCQSRVFGRIRALVWQFFSRESGGLIQFVKYGVTGVLQVALSVVIFAALAWKAFPALTRDEWVVRAFGLGVAEVEAGRRAVNYAVAYTLTFVAVTYVGYVVSAAWVFEPGRHSRRREMELFFLASLASYIAATSLSSALIAGSGVGAGPAYLVSTAVSVAGNYLLRKFFIFKR